MDKLGEAISETKNYAQKYGQKLSREQLFLRLISKNVYQFNEIQKQSDKSGQKNSWQDKFNKAELFTKKYLSKMKGILMVGITGSVAAEFASEGEDIDLLIVTRENEMWWWRLYLRFFIWWHKIPHRKFGKKEKADEFCFNLWLDKDNLEIPVSKRNLKNANDLIMMKVIWDKEGTYYKFLNKNKWVKNYLATGFEERIKISKKGNKKINSQKRKKIKVIINKFLFMGQHWYTRAINKQKPKKDDINLGQAFFHNIDRVQ
jgi:predicted nucleotidyltransferase